MFGRVVIENSTKLQTDVLEIQPECEPINIPSRFNEDITTSSVLRNVIIENLAKLHTDVPGSLPEHEQLTRHRHLIWGKKNDGSEITLNTSIFDIAYNEIVKRRKNTFLVPYVKVGRDFIDQLTKHLNEWNNEKEMLLIVLKATVVLLAVGLQKPS